jgi:phage gp36-like protein
MAYCTQDDIAKLVPPRDLEGLTSEDQGAPPDAEVIAEAINAADAEIDSYLLVRYRLPLEAPIPARVKGLSMDIAIQKLHLRRGLENPARRQAYEDAVKFLQSVAKGLAVIEGAAGIEPAGQAQDVTEITSGGGLGGRVFDRNSMRDM